MNDDAFAVTEDVGEAPGEANPKGLRLRGSKRVRDADKSCSGFARSLEAAGYDSFGALPMLKVAVRPLQHASCCFPRFPDQGGEAKDGPERPL
jgi:hypothetical protein